MYNCTRESRAAKRYTKKPRQTLVSSSLDSLELCAAVAHVFRLQKTSLMDSWGKGDGVCVLYCRFQGVCKVTVSPLLSEVTSYFLWKIVMFVTFQIAVSSYFSRTVTLT